MSENNYGALMMKSTVLASDNIDQILSPGIYPIAPLNSGSPDIGGGILIVHAGVPIRRTFVSDSTISMTSTHDNTTSTWSSWCRPLIRLDPFSDIKSDGVDAVSKALSNLGISIGTESKPGLLQISDAINANDSKVAASSAAVYKLLPKRVYAANDFIRIPDTPGGLMLQWGRLPSGEGINFPTPFTNNCLWCVVIPQSPSSGPFDMAYLYTRSFDRFGFLRSAATAATPCYWMAIGY